MATGTAWVLNLDADVELASIASGRPAYTPPARVLEVMKPHAALLASTLLGAGDVVVDESTPAGAARGLRGRAFCPTPRAVALLTRSGATPDRHPPAAVLVEVNGRAFASGLGQTLPGATFVRDLDEALRMLRGAPPDGASTSWRVKRAFGMAGRGQRVVTPGNVTDADFALLRGGIDEGGVQIEPNVRVELELGWHGMLDEAGSVTLGALVRQECDARGQWLRTELAGPSPWEAALRAEMMQTAHALHDAGYFGPFGLDAFTWRSPSGELRLQPRSEINARLSMGFPVGFGAVP